MAVFVFACLFSLAGAQVVQFFQIDPIASCFPKHGFDPHGFPAEDYYERIASAQRALGDTGGAVAH